jgi:hypothetical protein
MKPTKDDLMEKMLDNDIHSCELRLLGCTGALYLTPAHRHKRLWYKKRPELLWDFNQVIMACVNCHQKIESNQELTEEAFNKLRPK